MHAESIAPLRTLFHHTDRLTEHWDDEARDFAYPDGWPEGIDGDQYIAEYLDVGPSEASTAPAAGNSILHEMLHGGK